MLDNEDEGFHPRKRTSRRGQAGPVFTFSKAQREGLERDSQMREGGLQETQEWRTEMERVSRETQEACTKLEQSSWFYPEYRTFSERGQ